MKKVKILETDELTYRGDPVFSPLGDRMIFSSDAREHQTRQLYIYNLNLQQYYQLTDDQMDKDDPIFSPDGKSLAYFTDHNPQGIHDLAVMDWPNGQVRFPVAAGAFKWIHGPFWLADGKSILIHGVAAEDEHAALWVLHLDDGSLERIELPGVPAYAHGTMDDT